MFLLRFLANIEAGPLEQCMGSLIPDSGHCRSSETQHINRRAIAPRGHREFLRFLIASAREGLRRNAFARESGRENLR